MGIKKCKHYISEPLTLLWRESLRQGRVPRRFKEALVIPLLKPGKSRSNPESYRPVSLTRHLIKLFERIVKDSVQRHLEGNSLLGDFQHGFRERKSCLSQLLIYQDSIINN